MHLLARLAAAGDVEVFVPDMVRREFLTKKVQDGSDKLERAKADMLELAKSLKRPSEQRDLLNSIPVQLDVLREKFELLHSDEFEQWRASTSATILNFDPASFTSLMDDYFNGAGAYRQAKSREDFPDAIISSCICDLAKSRENIFVILKDGALRRHLNNVPKVTTTTGLSEFFNIEEVAMLVREVDARTKNVEEIRTYFSSIKLLDNLEQHVFGSDALFNEVYLGPDAVEGVESLAISGWGAAISEPDHSEVHKVRFEDATFIEPGHFSIKVEFNTSCRVDYCGYYADYMNLRLETRDTVGERSVSGDGVADLCEQREVHLEGFVDLYFPQESTVAELKIHSQYLSVRSPVISVELNVEHAIIV
ncbi:hypothetical protein SAMN05192563_1004219 [Paraburkholderia aspalathi]|uniref:DUF4935 domain-containing protein n=2 Tax=Paraburkholderia aspalathi TaxID=1324617 RepID=A0A1I7B6D6_9BURK|nr:hypothetical protein SAMN05192563_1004219 [Paraburkholderia aspalathi]